MNIFRRSFLRRLLLTELTAILMVWIILLAWVYVTVNRFGTGDLDKQMRFFAEALAEFSSREMNDPVKLANTVNTLERFYINYGVNYDVPVPDYQAVYQLWDQAGRLIYKSAAAPSTPLSDNSIGFSEEDFAGRRWRVVGMLSKDARVFVQVGEKLSIRRAMIKPLMVYLLKPLVLVLPIIGVFTWFAVVRGLYPLRELADEVSARTPQDMRPLQPTVSYAETEPLVHETNELLARLALALEAERSFTADAAHELRTPLAVISAQAHVLAQSTSSQEKAKALQDLQEGVERSAALVKQLLTLARLDSQDASLPRRLEDLNALVRERIAMLSPKALEKKIDIELLCSENITVSIGRERFVSVIDNLIDNAFRYTPAKGHVQVSLKSSARHVLLRVADDGPGIPPVEREKVVQRFYRLSGTDETGSGLGLAIVKRVVSLHGGGMRLSEGLNGHGLSVEIELSRAAL